MSLKSVIVGNIALLSANEELLNNYDPGIFHKKNTSPKRDEVDTEISIMQKNIALLRELLDLYEKARKSLDINSEFYVSK